MFAFLKLIPIKVWIYAAIAAAFAFVLMREKWAVDKAKRLSAENTQLVASLDVERKARAHEQRIAKEASDDYQKRLAAIDASPDLGPVRLCKRPRVSPTPEAGTALGSHAEATGHVESEDAPDIGPALSDFVEDCEANAAQLESLQSWVRAR
jgi:hypothetical protein